MPKVKISTDDLRTMYQHSLVIYKNKPVYIKEIQSAVKFHVFDLTTQRNVVVTIDEYDEFKAPARHLGFVNCGQYVIYMSRKPVRRYKVGLNAENAVYEAPERYTGILGSHLVASLYAFQAPELADTVFNRYPTIAEAYTFGRDGVNVITAFDRQFAVDHLGDVYYKTKRVGKLNEEPKTVYDIKWSKGYDYLLTLLDTNYEKSTPTA